MNHVDLFSGIGGFAYAAREVWGTGYHNVLFCDNNNFCQEVIKKNFGKDSVIYGDIRDVTSANWNGLQEQGAKQQTSGDRQLFETVANTADTGAERLQGRENQIFLLTGGFPCQPFSQAGKRRGTEDNRYLWPEMLRIIKDFKPTWVIGENVAGILSMAQYESAVEMGSETDIFGHTTKQHKKYGRGILYGIICELKQIGYAVQPFLIPACAVNAPHRRDRVWIIAMHSTNNGCGQSKTATDEKGYASRSEPAGELEGGFERPYSDARHPKPKGFQDGDAGEVRGQAQDKECKRPVIRCFAPEQWHQNWLEVATELCGVDDGLPAELDGFKLTKSGHRVERLKALGNAIVPQVAMEIMRAIKFNEEAALSEVRNTIRKAQG